MKILFKILIVTTIFFGSIAYSGDRDNSLSERGSIKREQTVVISQKPMIYLPSNKRKSIFTTLLTFKEDEFFTDENKTINARVGITYENSKKISVRLYKVDSSGSLSNVYFEMKDNGVSPDSTDKDGIFSVNAKLLETNPSRHCYRASVMYEGSKFLSEIECIKIMKHLTQEEFNKMITSQYKEPQINLKDMRDKIILTKNTTVGFMNFKLKHIDKVCLENSVKKLFKNIENNEVLMQKHISRIGDRDWKRIVKSKYLVIENKNKGLYLMYPIEKMRLIKLNKPFEMTANSNGDVPVRALELKHWIDMKRCIDF